MTLSTHVVTGDGQNNTIVPGFLAKAFDFAIFTFMAASPSRLSATTILCDNIVTVQSAKSMHSMVWEDISSASSQTRRIEGCVTLPAPSSTACAATAGVALGNHRLDESALA